MSNYTMDELIFIVGVLLMYAMILFGLLFVVSPPPL